MVGKSLWTAFQTITGIAGVSPAELGEILAAILALILLTALGQAIRTRRGFSLDPKESSWRE